MRNLESYSLSHSVFSVSYSIFEYGFRIPILESFQSYLTIPIRIFFPKIFTYHFIYFLSLIQNNFLFPTRKCKHEKFNFYFLLWQIYANIRIILYMHNFHSSSTLKFHIILKKLNDPLFPECLISKRLKSKKNRQILSD